MYKTLRTLPTRLWFRLIGAFILVIAIGLLVTVILARQGTATRFAHFMINHHMVRPEQLQAALASYYTEHGGWSNLDETLAAVIELSTSGVMSDMMGNMMGMSENRFQVIDTTGNTGGSVVADSHTLTGNIHPPEQPITGNVERWPILVDNTQVGELVVEGEMMVGASMRNSSLIAGVTRAVLIAGLSAGVVGLLLALWLVRQITHPLGSLTHAAGQIALGNLGVRVPVQSQDELGELATTFNAMADSLETQETLRRNLVADVAHELRTPLAGIQGTVEALQDGVFPVTTENLQTVHDQIMLLNRLVEDLRTLANAEAGQLSLDCLPLDLSELCQRHVAAFQPQARSKAIHLGIQTTAAALVQGDEQRLGQVLNNLLDNALRHTPAGGAIQVQLSTPEGVARLAVIDSGEGIDPTALPHLFDRFYRDDPSRDRRTGGSGLGLAIARQLVQAHGGQIWAESPPAGYTQGSAFMIELPRQK